MRCLIPFRRTTGLLLETLLFSASISQILDLNYLLTWEFSYFFSAFSGPPVQ